jgi:hypothetical protein
MDQKMDGRHGSSPRILPIARISVRTIVSPLVG